MDLTVDQIVLFLLIVAPQQNPWTLNSVSSQFSGSETIIQIQVTLLHKKIEFSLYTLTWGTCLLLTGLIISSAQARWALMAFVRNRWIFLVGMILFLVLWWIKTSLVFLGLIVGLLIVSLLLRSNISSRFLVDTQVFLLRLLTIFIFLFSLRARNADAVAHAPRLTEVQISREIRQLAVLDRAEEVVEAERFRAVERRHAQRRGGRQCAGITSKALGQE
mgnify:CR=1 FL=1